MPQTDHQVVTAEKQAWVQRIYHKYGGMLLGYLTDALGSNELAEKCLIDVFRHVAQVSREEEWVKPNNWCQLLKYTQGRLKSYTEATREEKSPAQPKFRQRSHNAILDQLTQEQKLVFCEFYYGGKQAHVIASRINKTEELTRKILKDAFDIIRRSCEN